jgi:hypothetical protein
MHAVQQYMHAYILDTYNAGTPSITELNVRKYTGLSVFQEDFRGKYVHYIQKKNGVW